MPLLQLLTWATLLTVASTPPQPAVTGHVVVISVDGLRPDAIHRYPARTLQRLAREGVMADSAFTVRPSLTLPSHASMLTGMVPERHGITWNDDRTDVEGVIEAVTAFDVAADAGLETAAFVAKAKLRHLFRPGSPAFLVAPSRWDDYWPATRLVPTVVDYLRHEAPSLLFVHVSEPDFAGHALGWMSFLYGWAVRRADGAVEAVLEAAEHAFGAGAFTVIVTADHGGRGRGHGTEADEDMRIPWIAWGEGVAAGAVLGPVHTTDTAPTILWLLGLPIPDSLDGQVVTGAFRSADGLEPDQVQDGRVHQR